MPTYKLRATQGDTLLDHLLHSRGVTDQNEKIAFLSPSYDTGCHDPFLLKDMQKTVDRILLAVSTGEKICVYSDFDADGIPGAVVLHDFFKKIGYENTFHYIPDRHMEGFGIHRLALEQIIKDGATLVISIDCGIAEIENASWVKEQGIDLIITDHHTPGAVLPDAFAIVNPKQADCTYPEKMLCGAGVIYKVVQALCTVIRSGSYTDTGVATHFADIQIKDGWEKWLLDMVGLATLSDMVPLRGENRVFAYFGLTVLRKTPRLGLVRLLKSLKINPSHLSEEDVAFMITPRINAASRMASPMDAFKLLSTTSPEEADMLVTHINGLNTERKTRVAHLVKAIKKSIEEKGLQYKEMIVVGNPDWQPPVLGLVATNIVRDYGKPVFLWGRGEDEVIKGSCRAPEGFDVVKIMREVPEEEKVFLNLGGHVAAGGYSVNAEKIHTFEQVLLDAHQRIAVKEASSENSGGNTDVLVDWVINPGEVGRGIWSIIEKVGPFGESNPKPLFLMKSMHIRTVKYFGKAKEHLEIEVESQGQTAKAIQFFAAEDKNIAGKAVEGAVIDLFVHMEKSMFKNYPEYRLRIVDMV